MLLAKNGRAARGQDISISEYYFVTDRIERGDIKSQYCATDMMITDFFTIQTISEASHTERVGNRVTISPSVSAKETRHIISRYSYLPSYQVGAKTSFTTKIIVTLLAKRPIGSIVLGPRTHFPPFLGWSYPAQTILKYHFSRP